MKNSSGRTCCLSRGVYALLLAIFLSAIPVQSSRAWGYYGTFYDRSTNPFGAWGFTGFASNVYKSATGIYLTYGSAPSYSLLVHCNSSYAADFAITTQATLPGFINYGAYSSYNQALGQFGVLSFRPGAGTYGFGVRNKEPINGQLDHDSFKNWSMDAMTVPDYNSGTNPKRYGGKYNAKAWVQSGLVSSGTKRFNLKKNPALSQDRAYVTSFTVSKQSSGGSYTRYVWQDNTDTLSAGSSSGLYIIPVSQYSAFINNQMFSFATGDTISHNGAGAEIRLPYGSYYVVAINAMNINTIHAGSCTSQIISYK